MFLYLPAHSKGVSISEFYHVYIAISSSLKIVEVKRFGQPILMGSTRTGGGVHQLGCYIFLVLVHILGCDTCTETVLVGGSVVFGPLGIHKYDEVRWLHNQSLIMYQNKTSVIYKGTNATQDSRPYRISIARARVEDAGNYTIEINSNENQTYYCVLSVINSALGHASTQVYLISLCTSLASYNPCVYFVVIIQYLYLTL
nr:glycoprotein E68-E52 [Elephant endotheliotropic herpesvirus 1A]